MFIVEGPDGAGKTTLISRLQDELQFEIMPRACTSEDGVDPLTLRDWVDQDMSRQNHWGGFYDRYPLISEPIYGPLIRGSVAVGFNEVKWFSTRTMMLRQRNPAIIYCLPPKEVVLHNIRQNHKATTHHLSGVLTHGSALYDSYCARAAIDSLVFDVWLWDYTKESRDRDFEELLTLARTKL